MRPHDLPEHKLDSAKSPLYPSAPRRVKRTYITNQMKRVQGDESPWRSLGRVAPADSPRKALQSQYDYAKSFLRRAANSVSRVPSSLRRDRHKETYKPEVNRQSSITISTIRERATGDLDPRRNRNATSRKPSCLALCGKQQA